MNKLLPLISFMFLLALPSTAYAKDELIVIQKESSDGKQREDYFYLIGTQSRGKPANFTLWRNQFDFYKAWDGKGNPKLTIENAALKATVAKYEALEARIAALEGNKSEATQDIVAQNEE